MTIAPHLPPVKRSTMTSRALRLVDRRFGNFFDEVNERWDYDDFVGGRHPDWFHDWISFDSLLADPSRDVVWCGLTRFDTDIFYKYDRGAEAFSSLNFPEVADRYDAKFHRALEFGPDGAIWAATALLHDVDRYLDAPGGAIVRFEPDAQKLEVIDRPLCHVYIQSIAIDQERGLLYGQTFTPERLFCFDLSTRKTKDLGAIGSGYSMGQSETIAIADDGTVWGSWSITRAWLSAPGPDVFRLWRYHPDEGRVRFLKIGLPPRKGGRGFAHPDGFHCGPDGRVYISSGEGVLFRMNPDSDTPEKLGKPGPHTRLSAFANGPDGKLYGAAGRDETAMIFSYDPASGSFVDHGSIQDADTGVRPLQIHDMTMFPDGTIYAGENDHPERASYLWEVTGIVGEK